MSISSISGGANGYHFYKTLVLSDGTDYVPTASTSQGLTPGNIQQGYLPTINSQFEDNTDFYTRINNIGSRTINTGAAAPIFSGNGMTPVTFTDGTTINLPSNGIWFKPSSSGKGIISFVIMNNGKNERHKSIYKYQRGAGGVITNITETKLTFAKGEFGNKHIVFFEYEITDADITGDYEFFIGSSSTVTDDQIQFYFLALAGSGTKGAVITPESKELLHVNFVHDISKVGDDVAANGMIVTTFDIKLTTSNAAKESVSFTRTAMDADASATVDGMITAQIYSHSAIILPTTDQSG